MALELVTGLTRTLLGVLQFLGYSGVFLALLLEGCWFPISTEVILLAAGYLAYQGKLTVLGIALSAAAGFALGSLLPYAAARIKGRAFVARYSRYAGISERVVLLAERWFAERGLLVLSLARLLPVLRAAVSVPAGLAPIPAGRYLLVSFLGYLPWGLLVAESGRQLGAHWNALSGLALRINQAFLVAAVLLALALWLLLRRLSRGD